MTTYVSFVSIYKNKNEKTKKQTVATKLFSVSLLTVSIAEIKTQS